MKSTMGSFDFSFLSDLHLSYKRAMPTEGTSLRKPSFFAKPLYLQPAARILPGASSASSMDRISKTVLVLRHLSERGDGLSRYGILSLSKNSKTSVRWRLEFSERNDTGSGAFSWISRHLLATHRHRARGSCFRFCLQNEERPSRFIL